MAKELQGNAGSTQTGLTTYFIVWNSVGQVRLTGGATFGTASAVNRNAGAISATELGTASGVYAADAPAFAQGIYSFALYKRAGGSPAESDILLAGPGELQWDGSAIVYQGISPATVRSNLDVASSTIKVVTDQFVFTNPGQVDAFVGTPDVNVVTWVGTSVGLVDNSGGMLPPQPAIALTAQEETSVTATITAKIINDHGIGSYVRNTEPVDVSTNVTAIKAKTDNLPASPAAVGSAMNLADNAITDAKFTFPSEVAGRPTTFLAWVRRIGEWVFNKKTRDRNTGIVSLRNATDSATLESQTQSTSGNVDTQTKGV